MQPDLATPGHRQRRARRVALVLAGAAVILATGGGVWFARFASRVGRDPGAVYRDPRTLEQLLQRANDAERAGDRATAITAYRFVAAVGQGDAPEVAPYVTAARAGLRRLGVADTLPDRPR